MFSRAAYRLFGVRRCDGAFHRSMASPVLDEALRAPAECELHPISLLEELPRFGMKNTVVFGCCVKKKKKGKERRQSREVCRYEDD